VSTKKVRAYIGIGSNLGNRLENCNHAVELIGGLRGCFLNRCSPWYITSPLGIEDSENWFINGVLGIDTTLSPHELLHCLLIIEKSMGRIRKRRWESRIIDLDLLLYGESIIDDRDLKVPHPLMHLRRFVLVPLTSIAPDLIHPVMGISIKELLDGLSEDDQEVFLLKDHQQ